MSSAYARFVASMNIGYDQWHDGEGYDLGALDALSADEKRDVERLLIPRKDSDWRDAEALARLGTPRALKALQESAHGPSREVRLRAAELLEDAGHPADLQGAIVEALLNGELGDGLAQAELLAEERPTEAIRRALLTGALCASDGRAVRFVALLYWFAGLAKEAFDWDHRPFFLRFTGPPDAPDRRAAFAELCERIKADLAGVTCP